MLLQRSPLFIRLSSYRFPSLHTLPFHPLSVREIVQMSSGKRSTLTAAAEKFNPASSRKKRDIAVSASINVRTTPKAQANAIAAALPPSAHSKKPAAATHAKRTKRKAEVHAAEAEAAAEPANSNGVESIPAI